MSKIYFPSRYIDVPASSPHEGDPVYRVSVGIEHWPDGGAHHVVKIQMAYHGVVAGRKSPSYPAGTPDWNNVQEAVRRLLAGEGEISRGLVTAA